MTDTEKTIAVPVSAIEALRNGADGLGAYGSTYHAAQALIALIPAPPKVGDTLTAAQVKALPPRSVLRDRDNDVWVTTERGPVYLTIYRDRVEAGDAEQHGSPADYVAVLVSLPRD